MLVSDICIVRTEVKSACGCRLSSYTVCCMLLEAVPAI